MSFDGPPLRAFIFKKREFLQPQKRRNSHLTKAIDGHFWRFCQRVAASAVRYIHTVQSSERTQETAQSFYQTNSEQAYELYKVAREFAQLTGNEHVYDLCTGTGTIANFVARRAKAVVGVEYVAEAIEDAKINTEINGITNTRFYASDMKNVLNEAFIQANGYPDVVITDPPRAGMDEPVVLLPHSKFVQSIGQPPIEHGLNEFDRYTRRRKQGILVLTKNMTPKTQSCVAFTVYVKANLYAIDRMARVVTSAEPSNGVVE